MQVRTFKAQDAEGVKSLILGILAQEYPFDQSAYSDSDINDIAGVYGGKGDTFFVLDDGKGHIIGTAGVKQDAEGSALLRRLFVHKNERKKGYGGQLINKALEFCKRSKYKYVVFRTTGRMKDAIELCKKRGFKQAEELDLGGFTIYKFVLEI